MLVQLRRRAAELAIRSAIGASQRQVVMVIVREVALLAIAGALAGALLAVWLTHAIATGFTIPRISEVTVDRRALAFAAGISALSAALFGLLPAILTTRRGLAPLLSSTGRGVFGGRHRLQGSLVVAQIALSVVLAGAAGLLVRSYGALSGCRQASTQTTPLPFTSARPGTRS